MSYEVTVTIMGTLDEKGVAMTFAERVGHEVEQARNLAWAIEVRDLRSGQSIYEIRRGVCDS